MRSISRCLLLCASIHIGCGAADIPQAIPAATGNQDAEAARLYKVAENLEKEGKTKDARGTYRHLLRDFPKTVQGKKARERIRRLPREA